MKLKDHEISGVNVEIHVNTNGYFTVIDGEGSSLSGGDSLDKALNAARPKLAARKVRVSIPFFTKGGKRGEATGLHAGTGAVLARIDGQSIQMKGYNDPRVLTADIPIEKLDRYLSLQREISARQRELRVIEQEFEINIAALTKTAVENAAAAASA